MRATSSLLTMKLKYGLRVISGALIFDSTRKMSSTLFRAREKGLSSEKAPSLCESSCLIVVFFSSNELSPTLSLSSAALRKSRKSVTHWLARMSKWLLELTRLVAFRLVSYELLRCWI